jgi:hypothetical protein
MLPIFAYVGIIGIGIAFCYAPFIYLYTRSIYFDRKVYERLVKYGFYGLLIPVINESVLVLFVILLILLFIYPKIARNINSFVLYF